jgi:hypothetical protein
MIFAFPAIYTIFHQSPKNVNMGFHFLYGLWRSGTMWRRTLLTNIKVYKEEVKHMYMCVYTCETSVSLHRTTWRNIPEERHLQLFSLTNLSMSFLFTTHLKLHKYYALNIFSSCRVIQHCKNICVLHKTHLWATYCKPLDYMHSFYKVTRQVCWRWPHSLKVSDKVFL